MASVKLGVSELGVIGHWAMSQTIQSLQLSARASWQEALCDSQFRGAPLVPSLPYPQACAGQGRALTPAVNL